MNATESRPRLWVPAAILVLALVLLDLVMLFDHFLASWPWSKIGVELAFAGVLVMLFRDKLKEYGDSYQGKTDAERLANTRGRRFARRFAPYVFVVGVPLVILGALFQIIGNPSDKLILRGTDIPKKVVFIPLDAKEMSVDLKKLDEALQTLAQNGKETEAALRTLTYPTLLSVNCGATDKCSCPPDYSRVRDIGGWNLNAGTKGDTITLCTKSTPYAQLQK